MTVPGTSGIKGTSVSRRTTGLIVGVESADFGTRFTGVPSALELCPEDKLVDTSATIQDLSLIPSLLA